VTSTPMRPRSVSPFRFIKGCRLYLTYNSLFRVPHHSSSDRHDLHRL
jgi:hypothetical protein